MKTRYKGLIALLIFLVIARAVLPSIILSRTNEYLANFSPIYAIHIDDLDLGLLTFSYTGQNTTGIYKKDNSKFFTTKSVRVQISFTELFHGRILTNVRIDDGSFVLTKALFAQGAKDPEKAKEDAKKAAKAMFPLRVAVIEFHNGSFDFADFLSQDKDTRWRVSEINSKFLNINPVPENPYTQVFGDGKFLDVAPFKIAGKAKRLETPMDFKVDFEMKNFKLTDSNPMLLHYLPFTFSRGNLDVYSEVAMVKGTMNGYVKPFIKDAKILKAGEDFKSIKHFAFEMAGAFANFMLKNADDKTVATKIIFKKRPGASFEIEGVDAALDAVKHGYIKELTPGIEDSIAF